jgi:glycine cleavage system transcriptional repressor
MKAFAILIVVAEDRPGIVKDVSEYLFDRGTNIEDSRMAALGGRFTVLTLFSGAPDQVAAVEKDLDALRSLGFETSFHPAEDPSEAPKKAAMPVKFEVTAMDQPGIVRQVVRILHRHKVHVRKLDTKVQPAPYSGAPLFNLVLEASVPSGQPINQIKTELVDLAGEMNMDISFR